MPNLPTGPCLTRIGNSYFGDDPAASQPGYDDAKMAKADLPHDWSIELPFG